jgi:endonuclease G
MVTAMVSSGSRSLIDLAFVRGTMMPSKFNTRLTRLLVRVLGSSTLVLWSAGASAYEWRVHSFHCLDACPLGAPENADLVVREIYTLAADPFTKMAVWVAYRITPETIGPSQTRNWASDPWLDAVETLEKEDYDEANENLAVDRGHQAPLAAFSGTSFWRQTNFLSNITPQSAELNQGPWEELESREIRLSQDTGNAVYVLTGPLFEMLMSPLPQADERHRVPSGYWKVVMTGDGRASAFIFAQDTPRNASHCSKRVPINEVELRARLKLRPWPSLQPVTLDSALGCP